MGNTKSILSETNFSGFNLRDAYIIDYSDYAQKLRDEAIFSNFGIKATIKVPKVENNVDEYSNFVDEDFNIYVESVVPLFDKYRQNVSVEGMSADGTEGLYPLDVIIPAKLHLPKNSRIVLNEYNSKDQLIAREWVVLSTEMKQLTKSKTISRVANCVPARETIHHTGELSETLGIFYFNIAAPEIYVDRIVTRAAGCTYFVIKEVVPKVGEQQEIIEKIISDEAVPPEMNEKPDVIGIEWQEGYEALSDGDVVKLEVSSINSASFVIYPVTISVLY